MHRPSANGAAAAVAAAAGRATEVVVALGVRRREQCTQMRSQPAAGPAAAGDSCCRALALVVEALVAKVGAPFPELFACGAFVEDEQASCLVPLRFQTSS